MMQHRLVENWLINAGELTYTIPFAQMLALKGFRVLHISKGGSVEQGKDIIALDANNEVHCYQLKCGNIGTSEWRKIKTEVDELVEIPPKHPSLPNEVKTWHSYLVTNGLLNNTSARTIDDYSNEKHSKGYSKLQTILKDELVEDFTQAYGSFFPDERDDLRKFLAIYNQIGDDTLDNEEFKIYFENYFNKITSKSKQKKLEAINASVVICSYLLTNKYSDENYLEIVKAWSLLLAAIYQYAAASNIADKSISATEQLIYDAIDLAMTQLIDEIVDNQTMLSDSSYGLLSEPFMLHKVRCTELLGFISAYINSCQMRNVAPYTNAGIAEKMVFMSQNKAMLGESYAPFIFNYIAFLLKIGNVKQALYEMSGLLNGVLSVHGREQPGMPSPYYSVTAAAEIALDLDDSVVKESFEGRSFTLWPIVLLLARCDMRDLIAHHWRLISQISCQEIIPDEGYSNDLLLWRCDNSTMNDTFPNEEQSWAALQAEASKDMSAELPNALLKRQYFIPYLINVMPHRCSKSAIMSLVS